MKPIDLMFPRSVALAIAGSCLFSIATIYSCKEEETPDPTPVPVILESFSPTKGPSGTVVTISGSNFSVEPNGNTVSFNGVDAVVTASSATSITTSVPATATTGKIKVTADRKEVTSIADFIVIQPPVISSFTPTKGPMETVVTISGRNFSLIADQNKAFIGNVPLFVSDPTTNSLKVTIPAEAVSGKIKIEANGFSVTSAQEFTVTPFISSFEPATGPVGTVVTITGAGFSPELTGNVVKFGTVAAVVSEASLMSLKVTVPAGAVTGKISITTGDNSVESRSNFVVQ